MLIDVNLLVDFGHGMFIQTTIVFVMETPAGANVAAINFTWLDCCLKYAPANNNLRRQLTCSRSWRSDTMRNVFRLKQWEVKWCSIYVKQQSWHDCWGKEDMLWPILWHETLLERENAVFWESRKEGNFNYACYGE